MTAPPIRPVRPDELERLRTIERAAGAAFREVGLPAIADDEPPAVSELRRSQAAGQAWVAVDSDDVATAYVLAEVVDGNAHIVQLSVHPLVARRRIGSRLLDHVGGWARDHGLAALTLTTFRAVPWNAPYYLRLGFRVLDPAEYTPGLRAVLADEAAAGLDPAARVCMRRELG